MKFNCNNCGFSAEIPKQIELCPMCGSSNTGCSEEEDPAPVIAELERLRGSLSRAQADYSNLLKRVERDKVEMTSFLTANIVKKFLPTVDNLERALANVPADIAEQKWTEGIRATLQGLTKQLETMGVQSFVSQGQEVDTERHEVMSQAPGKEGIIITEFEKGYTLHGRVIRHAKVIVGSGE